MASAGEPLKGRHGVLLYSAQVSKGTAVTPATAVGLASFDVTFDSDTRPLYGLGSANALFFKPGIAKTDFSISIENVQELGILTKAARSSGVLPWLTFGFGVTPDGGTNDSKQVQDCKINSLQLDLESGGFLRAQLSGTGGLATTLTSLSATHLSTTPFMSYEAILTKGGSDFKAISFSLSIENNIDVQSCIRGTAASTFKRGWDFQTEGQLVVTGEITRYAKSGVDLHADTFTDFDMVLTCTDIVGGGSPNTIAITVTDAVFGSERWSNSPEGDCVVSNPFLAKTFTIA